MSNLTKDRFWRRSNPIMWGVIATIAVALFGFWAATLPVCETRFWGEVDCKSTKWVNFLNAQPNEVGDTLAGFAGALAFVWIIATVWLQGKELAAQREELELTRKEFNKMAGAQQKQVEILTAQGEIFAEEQRQRVEQSASNELDQMLHLLISKISLYGEIVYCAAPPGRYFSGVDNRDLLRGEGDKINYKILPAPRSENSIEENVEFVARSMAERADRCRRILISKVCTEFSGDGEIIDILDLLDKILAMEGRLGNADRYRFARLRLGSVKDELSGILVYSRELGANP